MTLRILFILIFASCQLFSQNSNNELLFEFDYVIEYKSFLPDKSITNRGHFRLLNSKTNDYSGLVNDLGNEKFKISFHWKGKIYTTVEIEKEDFFKAETINIGENYNTYVRYFPPEIKPYKVDKLSDTILDGVSYNFFRFYMGRSKVSGDYLAIQEISDFNHLATSESYMSSLKMNNFDKLYGVHKLYYTLDRKGNIVEGGNHIVGYQKHRKFIKIKLKPQDLDLKLRE